jgi:hypothetical protein
MSKFGNLAANVSEAFRVPIIDALTDEVLRDKDGREAYIEVLAADSVEGRAFDRERTQVYRKKAARTRGGVPDVDQFEENAAKCAALTKGWYLVDPITKEPIDVACNRQNALELYTEPGMHWLFVQPWVAANDAANFIKSSSKASTPLPSTSFGPGGA